jgi:hypothetical protein
MRDHGGLPGGGQVAEEALGAAVPASDLFNALAPSLVNSNVLLNEINTRIQKLDDGTDEGRLCRDLSGRVFLIGKLSRQNGGWRLSPAASRRCPTCAGSMTWPKTAAASSLPRSCRRKRRSNPHR